MTDCYITTDRFLELIRSEFSRNNECEINLMEFKKQGVRKGWLPVSLSTLGEETFLDHKNAAHIVHEFLKIECEEPDEEDINLAKKLKDLYDCHTCVNHIAQVYIKGIMGEEQSLFGTNTSLMMEEAELISIRIFDKNKRTHVEKLQSVLYANKIALQEAIARKENDSQIILIDVRSQREYQENHLQGAIGICLSEILKNPYQVAESKFTTLLFYCENGYQSEIAANCVREAGYQDVWFFALTE